MGTRATKPFNNPFGGLRQWGAARLASRGPDHGKPVATEPPQHPPARADEHALFAEAVAGAVPVAGPALAAPRPGPAPDLPPLLDPDAAALAALEALVAGQGRVDVLDTDEGVEGPGPTADPMLAARLRAGAFSVQRHVDLHGLGVEDARGVLGEFLREARRRSLRCVLVVHGRGLHSKDGVGVLKQRVVGWLSRGSMSRGVLAFSTARPHDGGAGALYVLLRR